MTLINKTAFLVFIALLYGFNGVSQDWLTSFEKAKTSAKENQKPIVLVFQGSDWCAPCIKLDHEIWSTPTFITYAKEHYVLLKADFPRKKKNELSVEQAMANSKLAEQYNKRGIFPLVVLLNASGKELGRTGYKRITPTEYIDELNQFLD